MPHDLSSSRVRTLFECGGHAAPTKSRRDARQVVGPRLRDRRACTGKEPTMAYTKQDKDQAHARTGGRCHLCAHRIVRSHYGRTDVATGWEMEHSKARTRGGVDDGRNRYAAHPWCNRAKGTRSSRSVRRKFGLTRAPLSFNQRARQRRDAALELGATGAAIGGAIGGPAGAVLGGLLGALLGDSTDPEE